MQKIHAITLASTVAIAGFAALFFAAGNPPQVFSQESTPLSGASTIKVKGEATRAIEPDQAVMILSSQTEPDSIPTLVEKHDKKIDNAVAAIMAATGNNATVYLGQINLNSEYYYSELATYSNLTFSIDSSISVPVSIGRLSDVINKLSQAGFRFETLSWQGSSEFVRELQYGPGASGNASIADDPVILSVSISTDISTLEKAIEEYGAKYEKLLEITGEEGIPRDSIEPANVNISPSFDRSGQDYNIYSQLVVKTSIGNVEKVAEAARRAGLNVDSVYLSASDLAIDRARQELNLQALENAKSRADEIAQPLGLDVKGIRSIEVVVAAEPRSYGDNFVYRGISIVSPNLYQSMIGEISAAVTVEFELGG